MFSDRDWEEAELIAQELSEGNRPAFREFALALEEMVGKSNIAAIPLLLAVIVCLLPPAAQTRIKFGDN